MPRQEPDSLLSAGGVPTCNKPSVSSSLSSMDSSRLVAPCLYLQMICVQSDMRKKAKTVVWHQDLHSIGWAGLASLAWAGFCDCHGIDPSNFSGTYLPAKDFFLRGREGSPLQQPDASMAHEMSK